MQNDQIETEKQDEQIIVIEESDEGKDADSISEEQKAEKPLEDKKESEHPGKPTKHNKESKKGIYLILALIIVAVLSADILKLASHIRGLNKQKKQQHISAVLPSNYTHKKAEYEIKFFQIQRNILSGNIKNAIKRVDELTQNYRASAYFLLGKALFDKKEYSSAALYLNKSILLKPENKEIYLDLLLTYIKQNEPKKAMDLVKQAAVHLKDKDYILALRAALNLYLKNYEKSSDEAKDIDTERFIDNIALNDILGTIHTIAGRYRIAKVYFKRALFLNPKDIMAKNNLAMLYFETGKPKTAIAYLKGFHTPTINYIKAVSYLRLNNPVTAYKILSKLPKNWNIPKFIEILPYPIFNEKKIKIRFVDALINEKLSKTIMPLKISINRNPIIVAKLYNAVGISKLVIGSLRKGANWYEAITAAKKANIYYAAGKLEKALSLLEAAHKKASEDPIISFNLSLVLIKHGMPENALKIIKKTVKRYPNFPLQYLLGEIAEFQIGNYKQARAMESTFQDILKTKYKNSSSDEINSLKSLADALDGKKPSFLSEKWLKIKKTALWIYNIKTTGKAKGVPYKLSNLDNYQGALKITEDYIQLYPKNFYLRYIKGYLLYKLKRYKKAISSFYDDISQNSVGYHTRLGALLLLTGDYKNAYLEFYKTTLSETRNEEGYFGLGLLEQIKGNKDKMMKYYTAALSNKLSKSEYIKIDAVFKNPKLNNK